MGDTKRAGIMVCSKCKCFAFYEDGSCVVCGDMVKEPYKSQHESPVVRLLKKYEEWEAVLIADNRCWGPEGMASYPRLTKDLYDVMLELQKERNEVLKSLL